MAEAGVGRGRWLAVCGLSVLLALALACVALRDAPSSIIRPSQLLAKQLSFAKWYQEQSAAAWFGDDTMPKKVHVGNQEFAEKNKKAVWLTKSDMTGITAVLRAQQAKKRKNEAVQLAMAKLMAKQQRNDLPTALTQGLKTRQPKEPVLSVRSANAAHANGKVKTQELFQLTQKLEEPEFNGQIDKHGIYRPLQTAGDGAELPWRKIVGTVNALNEKFINRSTSTYDENMKHLHVLTPEEIAQEKAVEAAKKAAEEATDKMLAGNVLGLEAIKASQTQLRAEQDEKLTNLTQSLNDVLNGPEGYKSADITQCGNHCVEVDIAARATATKLRQDQLKLAEKAHRETRREDRELKIPIKFTR